jgi:hypothetical protein
MLDLRNVIGRGNSSNFGMAPSWDGQRSPLVRYAPRALARARPPLLVAVRVVGT